ncbi:MAG: TIM44-like domain-containing protein [Rhodospirillaceae bacterium]|nr:TIM44-like domain-containing protein [Rhodospirillales bacterium]
MRHKILSVFLAVLVALSVGSDAWAKAGKGSSLGSRGSRTYDRPVERTTTAPPAPTASQPSTQQPMYNPSAARPGMAAAAPVAQPSFFQRNPMMAGIMGGLVGAGIGSMLFGHSPALAAATDAAPGAGMLGTLLQFALIGGLAYMAYRFFARRRQQQAPVSTTYQRGPVDVEALPPTTGPATGFGAATAPRRIEKEFEPSPADQETFSQIIMGVQKAWTEGNPVALRSLATPEVVGWMSEDLSRDQSKGMRNVVEDVNLLKGDITESWRDAELEYATAVITFSAKDYMVRVDNGQVVEGNSTHPVETVEAWTFVRSAGGRWLLSAIEQV